MYLEHLQGEARKERINNLKTLIEDKTIVINQIYKQVKYYKMEILKLELGD